MVAKMSDSEKRLFIPVQPEIQKGEVNNVLSQPANVMRSTDNLLSLFYQDAIQNIHPAIEYLQENTLDYLNKAAAGSEVP